MLYVRWGRRAIPTSETLYADLVELYRVDCPIVPRLTARQCGAAIDAIAIRVATYETDFCGALMNALDTGFESDHSHRALATVAFVAVCRRSRGHTLRMAAQSLRNGAVSNENVRAFLRELCQSAPDEDDRSWLQHRILPDVNR